jgi:hypothetical protein
MATIDIFSLEPSVISRDLKGKYIAIYGREKVGKSTFGAHLPRALFCNFEVGTNFLSVKKQNISKCRISNLFFVNWKCLKHTISMTQ